MELLLPQLTFTIFNIDDFQFALTDQTGIPLTSCESINLGSITDGTYGILFRGQATGTSGGSVSGLVALASVSAVPVPPAVWLFGSALLGLISFSHTRKSML